MAKFVKMASLLILLCFIMASTILVNVRAEVLGVSQGNVFEYNMIARWNSPSQSAPPELLELNQTKMIKVTVSEVSGSLISTKILTSYQNGTESTADGSCNIGTGECTGLPFIGANLEKNDLVNPSASEHWYVNETVTRTYQDDPRETNHLKIEDTGTSDGVGVVKSTYDYYFDKSTGVLVEYTTELSYNDVSSITESKLLASNVWQVNGDLIQDQTTPTNSPATLYMVVAITAIIIAVIAATVILKKKKKQTATSP